MKICLTQLTDVTLVENAKAVARHERATTADLVAYVAEIERRAIHAAAGYSSMRAWCVAELGLSVEAPPDASAPRESSAASRCCSRPWSTDGCI